MVQGNVNHDDADSGYPVKIGGKAETTAPEAVGDGDRVNAWFDEYGRIVVALKDVSGNLISLADDAAFTPGTSSVLPVGFFADETTPDSVTEGDIGAARMTLSRILWTALRTKTSVSADTELMAGQQAKASSLSVAPATDITDATYIGDIKFGESLPAGTAAIGKLAANSGVDIGDVDVLTVGGVTPLFANQAQRVALYDGGGSNSIGALSASSDNQGTSQQHLTVGALGFCFNGGGLDRWRNNTEGTLLASAARTTTTNSADQTNYNARGVRVRINVSSVTDTPSITVAIQEKDSISGNYVAILTSAAITTTGQKTTLVVYPGATGVANAVLGEPLPRTWRIAVTHGDADSITYSVDYAYIL